MDTAGNIVNSYDYDVWGNFITKQETIDNPFTYFGQTYDETTGLYYLRARYYDPQTGRFTQQDPAEDGYNWYVYGNQNPVLYADYSGESIVIAGMVLSGELMALLGTGFMILGYLASKVFVEAFTSAVNMGKSIRDSIIYAKGKAKAPEPPSKLKDGDKVKTPDSHKDEFTKDKNGDFIHNKTGWKAKKARGGGKHGGEHWDLMPPNERGHINVGPDGNIF